ncbi:MAG: diguanylate cyclase [Terracidiphilus sp.]
MKRLIIILGVLLSAWQMTAQTPSSGTLTSVSAIHALTNVEASHGIPVEFEGTVTFNRDYERIVFIQEDGAAIYVGYPTPLPLVPGDRVRVKGRTARSFSPIVSADSVTVLSHGTLPKAEPVSYDQLISAESDCKLVTVRATVRTVDQTSSITPPHFFMRLQLIMDGGYLSADVSSQNAGEFNGLLDADVEITGIASEKFDNKMHMTGINLQVQSIANIQVVKRAGFHPSALAFTPMDKVIKASHFIDTTQRVRVRGSITYYLPGSAVVLQDGDKSIWINTQTQAPLRIGDQAEATGFPEIRDGFVDLARAEVYDSLNPEPVPPLETNLETLSRMGFNSPGHHDDLISIEGKVVTEVWEDAQDELVLSADGKLFSAIFRHPNGLNRDAKPVPLGSKVRVTGICIQESSDPFATQIPFKLLLRSREDIALIQNPSLLNIRNLLILVGLLLVLAVLAGARGWVLERKVRQKTTALAQSIEAEAELQRRSAHLEQMRSRILEHINGSQLLTEILEEIAALISFTLEGAPCWCKVASGACLGNEPQDKCGLRILDMTIGAHTAPSSGTIYVGFDAAKPQAAGENEALQIGARLATLAVETRRLYSDLRRRSEYDLLTDIPNRFAMEKFMDLNIEEARCGTALFGLIFIDLDKFKPINDRYGHHVGDLYLQEVALRMNRQLLGGDMLARLGGDEFVALVSLKHGRFDLDHIIARLKQCFDEPFILEGHVIQGEASIGFALYPQDGVTRDELLNAADTAMYSVKKNKRSIPVEMAQGTAD